MARKPNETVQLKLRFPESLRRKLAREAARNDRSMNAEIIKRLEQSLQPPPLDLFGLLQSAIEKAELQGCDDMDVLSSVSDALMPALIQLVPDLFAVQLSKFGADEREDAHVTTFSPRATARIESHEGSNLKYGRSNERGLVNLTSQEGEGK